MTSFLLIISFLLHLITLTAIYQLLKKMKSLEEDTNAIDVAVALEQSLEELKEENNRLEQLLYERDKASNLKIAPESDNKQATTTNEQEEITQMREDESSPIEEDITHLVGTNPGYEIEQSLESRILQLHKEGKSIETIAKTLHCGKTEAELVIKMYG